MSTHDEGGQVLVLEPIELRALEIEADAQVALADRQRPLCERRTEAAGTASGEPQALIEGVGEST